jgi:hypothetical protein
MYNELSIKSSSQDLKVEAGIGVGVRRVVRFGKLNHSSTQAPPFIKSMIEMSRMFVQQTNLNKI